jgi:hypothetical protein
MASTAGTRKRATDRATIIQTVSTPLGFFVLVVLVVEALIGLLAGLSTSADRPAIVNVMVGLIVMLTAVVALLAYFRPEALKGDRAAALAATLPLDSEIMLVKKPKVLVAATSDFRGHDLSAEQESAALVGKDRTQVTMRIEAGHLREMLVKQKFDIVHLVAFADQASGKLKFEDNEYMQPAGLVELIKFCQARLVVLAACDSLSLGANLSRITNVVAASAELHDKEIAAWAKCFYEILAQGHPLSNAFDASRSAASAGLVLLLKQDVRFSDN